MAVVARRGSALYSPFDFSSLASRESAMDGGTLIWPPLYPSLLAFVDRRTGGVPLSAILDAFGGHIPTNRDEWTAKHWQQYAEFLEGVGEDLLSKALAREEQLFRDWSTACRKLSRGKRNSPLDQLLQSGTTLKGLLYPFTKPRPSRGRKPGGKNQNIALECLAIRSALADASGKRVTDKMALEHWLQQHGQRKSRASQMAGVLSEMSRQRKLQKLQDFR